MVMLFYAFGLFEPLVLALCNSIFHVFSLSGSIFYLLAVQSVKCCEVWGHMFLICDDLTSPHVSLCRSNAHFLDLYSRSFSSHFAVKVTLVPGKLIVCFPFLLAAPVLGPQERLISGGR